MRSGGIVDYYNGVVNDSYGRTISPSVDIFQMMVHVTQDLMVASIIKVLHIFPTDYSKFSPNSRVDYTSYSLLPDGSSDDYYVYQVYSSYGTL